MSPVARIILAAVIIAVIVAGAIYLYSSGLYLRCLYEFKETTFENECVSGTVRNGVVTLTSDDAIIFETDSDIIVQDAMLIDIDKAENEELVILCWKRGHFGEHRPFWVTEDTRKWIQHIYIYTIRNKNKREMMKDSSNPDALIVRPKWMASDIGMDVEKMEKEGRFIKITDTSGEESLWYWDSWGLTRKKW